MKLKFLTDKETLFDKVMPELLDEKLEEELMKFNEREIISLQLTFVKGTKVEETTNVSDIDPDIIDEIIIKVI